MWPAGRRPAISVRQTSTSIHGETNRSGGRTRTRTKIASLGNALVAQGWAHHSDGEGMGWEGREGVGGGGGVKGGDERGGKSGTWGLRDSPW
jgi:hypothetical protein